MIKLENAQDSPSLMDVEHLRKALKLTWLNYYRANRQWLVRLGVWVNYEEARRPSASFILGMLSVAEPELIQLLPLVVDLNSNPDRVVVALGLNFNPEDELEALEKSIQAEQQAMQPRPKMLLSTQQAIFEPELEPELESELLSVVQPMAQPVIQPIVQSIEPVKSSRPARRIATRSPVQQAVQPNVQQPVQQPAQPPTKQPNRRTLDTAQLDSQELPDRI